MGVVSLRQIEISDCTPSYVEWLNDTDVNQYLETRWSEQTLDSIRDFVKSQRENDHSIFAIGSWKALEHNGFKREAIFKEQAICKELYIDVYRYGLLKSEFGLMIS